MFDLVIKGGIVIDGTGAPGIRADVGIRDGRVVDVGECAELRRQEIDADGLIVAPGFVDVHTHYDVQVFWDGMLAPSPLHGVTTVVGGNCGFSVAPLSVGSADYLRRMLSEVEGIPIGALEAGASWDWTSTADYLHRIKGRLGPNMGFLVGHSALRCAVMRDDALDRAATHQEIAAMQDLLRQGLTAGALGFSSSLSPTHNDHEGHPVPSRASTAEELVSLSSVLRGTSATAIEFIPDTVPFREGAAELMAAMSSAAGCPLNWNVLQVYADNAEVVDRHLAMSDEAERQGGRVVALTLPGDATVRMNFRGGFGLSALPGWAPLMAQTDEKKLAMLSDPRTRADMGRKAQSLPSMLERSDWAAYTVMATSNPEIKGLSIGEIAMRRGVSPWNALADLVVEDGLDTVICRLRENTDEVWSRRVAVWRDPRAVVGASDAGAHVDCIDSFAYCTKLLDEAYRQRGLLPLEEAVSLLTDAPARLYGLRDRGRLAPGYWADVVVFDPTTISPGSAELRADLPGGARRLYSEAVGIHHVLVAGEQIVTSGAFTEARPGRILHAGEDTTPAL